jgi:hypothetical protein
MPISCMACPGSLPSGTLLDNMSFRRSTDNVKSALDAAETTAMAFQAPAWAPWREVRKGLYCVRLWVTVGRGRSIAAQARPRVADTAPLSGERDVLWNGSSAQRLFARNADLCGMSSSALTAKPQSRDTTPEEWHRLKLFSWDRRPMSLRRKSGGATSGQRVDDD